MPTLIEVCVESADAAVAAADAGANRIELNLGLALDGLTPSPGLVHSVVESVSIPVIAMARPRAGGFQYTDSEWKILCMDVTWLLDQGVAGIAFGALDSGQNIDLAKCDELRARTDGFELVFHRAFDVTSDASKALVQLTDCGIDRILTSGQRESAVEGIDDLASLIQLSAGKIEILPGAGINSQNAREIVTRTGCTQIHGSFSRQGNLPAQVCDEVKKTVLALADES